MSRTTNHPETAQPTIAGVFNPNSELEEHCYKAVQALLQENDALFKKHEPRSITLIIRPHPNRGVLARATIPVYVSASSTQRRADEAGRWNEETKFDQQ